MEYKTGDRVELHPATDAWMSGDRFGVIKKVGRKVYHVKMDRSGRVRKIHPRNILKSIAENPRMRRRRKSNRKSKSLAKFFRKPVKNRKRSRNRKRKKNSPWLFRGHAAAPKGWKKRRSRRKSRNRRSSPAQLAYRKLVKKYGVKGASRHWKKRK